MVNIYTCVVGYASKLFHGNEPLNFEARVKRLKGCHKIADTFKSFP